MLGSELRFLRGMRLIRGPSCSDPPIPFRIQSLQSRVWDSGKGCAEKRGSCLSQSMQDLA